MEKIIIKNIFINEDETNLREALNSKLAEIINLHEIQQL